MSLSRCQNTAISVIPVRLKRGHQSLCANRAREQLRAQLKRPWHRVCCVRGLRGERITKKGISTLCRFLRVCSQQDEYLVGAVPPLLSLHRSLRDTGVELPYIRSTVGVLCERGERACQN